MHTPKMYPEDIKMPTTKDSITGKETSIDNSNNIAEDGIKKKPNIKEKKTATQNYSSWINTWNKAPKIPQLAKQVIKIIR